MNSRGGDLVFGVQRNGDITGVEICEKELDGLQRTLQDVLANWLDPSPAIGGISLRGFEIAEERFVIVVRVKPSWIGPHQVSLNNARNYPVRRGNENSLMTHQQLLDALVRRASVETRLTKELDNVPKSANTMIVVVANVEAVAENRRVFNGMGDSWNSVAGFFGGCSPRPTRDGFILSRNGEWDGERIHVKRTGTIYLVRELFYDNDEFAPVGWGIQVLTLFQSARQFWSDHDLDGPALISLKLYGMEGEKLKHGHFSNGWARPCSYDALELEPFELTDFRSWSTPTTSADAPDAIRFVLADLYGAFGVDSEAGYFDAWWTQVHKHL